MFWYLLKKPDLNEVSGRWSAV